MSSHLSASPVLGSSAAPLPSTPSYSSSSQRQLGSEHPLSVAVQLHTGRLFSQQLAKGLAFLPCFTTGDTIGVGFVYAALTATPSPSSSSSSASSPAGLHGSAAPLFTPSSLLPLSSSASSAFSAPSIPPSSLSLSSYLFFTKNGKLIPDKEVSFDHVHLTACAPLTPSSTPTLSTLFFPALSFHSPSESVQANFGQSPFLFDLSTYAAEMREKEVRVRREVEYEKSLLLPLIKEFLIWHAYDGTLQVLEESEGADTVARAHHQTQPGTRAAPNDSAKTEIEGLRKSVQARGRIRQLIQASKVDDALALLRSHYPATMKRSVIHFLLHSLTFIAILSSPQEVKGASPPALQALMYARQHMWKGTEGREEMELLPRLMGLLALKEEEWEDSEWMGSEWREKVADRVNEEIVRLERQQRRGGAHSASANATVDSKEEKPRPMPVSAAEMKDEGEEVDGMEVEEGEVGYAGELKGGVEAPLGSAVELVLAQLLTVDHLWRQQRPLLPHTASPEEDVQRALQWLEQR